MPMTLIASQTLSSSAATVTFSSIPQTYKTLKIVGSTRVDYTTTYYYEDIYVNIGSVAFTAKTLYGSGSSANSASTSGTGNNPWGGKVVTSNCTANTWSNWEITFPNYTSSNYKVFSADAVSENNATAVGLELNAGMNNLTSAITSITLGGGTSMIAGSTFYLYGLS